MSVEIGDTVVSILTCLRCRDRDKFKLASGRDPEDLFHVRCASLDSKRLTFARMVAEMSEI